MKVRLAGLWEGPAGRLGLEKSANPLVKEAGRHLISGHAELDAKILELGRTLNVPLPSEANADQQGWITEMTNAPAGSVEFDHIQVLEASGMVDFNDTEAIPLAAIAAAPVKPAAVPTVPQAVPNVPRTQNIAQEKESDGSDAVLGILVMVAVVGGIYLWTGGRPRRSRSSRQ